MKKRDWENGILSPFFFFFLSILDKENFLGAGCFARAFSQLPVKGNPLASNQKVWQGEIAPQFFLWWPRKEIQTWEKTDLTVLSHPHNFSLWSSSTWGHDSQILDQVWSDYNWRCHHRERIPATHKTWTNPVSDKLIRNLKNWPM